MEQASSRVLPPSRSNTSASDSINRNALIFGIFMMLLQVGLSLIYGFLVEIKPTQLNASSVIVTIGLAVLVIGGFGLLFGYTRRLAWSGIGFTFFITAFCIEVYPLINDFWTRTFLQTNNSPIPDFTFDNKIYNVYLSDRETALGGKATYYGNSITNAIKCALSVAVAFSAILGRVGHLECLLVSIFGAIGFELNRQLVQQNQGTDTFGTFYIFTFGGFMGLGLGLMSLIRENKVLSKLDIKSLKRYIGSEYSVLYSTFGALIIFALFPLIAYEIDAYSRYSSYSPHVNPTCIIAALGAGAIGAILASALINGAIISRDAIHGPIAGAIACGASALYITNPVYAFVAGAAGGISQAIIQNLVERLAIKKKLIVSTVSWSLFGIQGIIGAGFAAGWKAISFSTISNSMPMEPSTLQFTSQFQFYGGLISAGIGAAFGLVAGALILVVNGQRSREYFEDYYYWFNCDSIRYDVEEHEPVKNKPPSEKPLSISEKKATQKQEPEEEIPEPEVEPVNHPPPLTEPDLPIAPEAHPESSDEFDFSLANDDNVANPYAYL